MLTERKSLNWLGDISPLSTDSVSEVSSWLADSGSQRVVVPQDYY